MNGNFFDFLKGDTTIPIAESTKEVKVIDQNRVKNQTWYLYTFNPESFKCPLDCIIISNYFKFVAPELVKLEKIVKCTSCSPNGKLPILVAESDGKVLEFYEIIKAFFDINNIPLYVVIDGLIGNYIRSFSGEREMSSILKATDVIEFIESLQTQESYDPSTIVLLFSMVQGAKIHLRHSDPVRMSIERSEYLNVLFIDLLESLK